MEISTVLEVCVREEYKLCYVMLCYATCDKDKSECKNKSISLSKFCIVLYCIVLYCIVLYCVVLYCIVLYCIVLYLIDTDFDKLYCVTLF